MGSVKASRVPRRSALVGIIVGLGSSHCFVHIPEVAEDASPTTPDSADARSDSEGDGSADAAESNDSYLCEGDGTPCPGGSCYDGQCCEGCWDGSKCQPGNVPTVCGREGQVCVACACALDTCSGGQCEPASKVVHVAAGSAHTCVVLGDATLWCWGGNDVGQANTSEPKDVSLPAVAAEGDDWAWVAGGYAQTCGLKTNGTRVCWGANALGELGIGDTDYHAEPVSVTGQYREVALGFTHGCATTSLRDLYCWGDHSYGKLGAGQTQPTAEPAPVFGGGKYEDLSVGRHHSCGVRVDGGLWCWGSNVNGELGLGDFVDRDQPERVGTETSWDQVGAGAFHTCGVKQDSTLHCWGGNLHGQLGQGVLGTNTEQNVPTAVGTGHSWAHVSSGRSHVCAVSDEGQLWCWGKNDNGQLGVGHQEQVAIPTRVGDRVDWYEVAGGEEHTCAIRGAGELYCWGLNDRAQLGFEGSLQTRPARVCLPSVPPG